MLPNPPDGTLPLAGRAGEGGAKRSSLAKKLRARPTTPEIRLWRILHQLRTGGYHFRKQVHIGAYYVDFACIHAGLVIEVDGHTHGTDLQQSNDATRDDYLNGRGFTVLRFSNHDVMTNADGVFLTIEQALQGRPRNHRGSPPPSPTLPAGGRVPAGSRGTISPASQGGTSPLAGEAGRGGAAASKSL